MAREGILFTLGNPLLDISADVNDLFLKKYDLESNTAILAEEKHLLLYNELCEQFRVDYIPGGATQNTARVAQWIIQVPNAVVYTGCIGNDHFGEILQEKIREVGVHTLYQHTDEQQTGTCAVLITGKNRSLVAYLAAANLYKKEFLIQPDVWQHVEKADYFYIAGFPLTVCPDAMLAIGQYAASHNKLFAMNLSAPFLCQFYREPMDKVLPYVDILFANEPEAEAFAKEHNFGTTDVKQMALLTAALPKVNSKRSRIVIFTRGSDPAVLVQDGVITEYPACQVPPEDIVDTNGAGDAFVGGFLAQLIKGRSMAECMKCAHYVANLIIQRSGCTFPDTFDFTL